jgi:antitoxin HicB
MILYPATLERDTNGTILVNFPDVPEAHTFGDDEDEALMHAADALETALGMYIEDRRDIPKPSACKRGMKPVTLPALAEAKIGVYNGMRRKGIGKAELARRLNWHLPQVDRLLDLLHSSRLDQIEAALRAIGMRLEVAAVPSSLPPRKAATPATGLNPRRRIKRPAD